MPEEMTALLLDYGIKIVGTIASIALLSLYAYLKSLLTAKVGAEKLDVFARMAETTVRALEQENLIRKLDGPALYEIATINLRNVRDQLKLDIITDEMIDKFIEANVQVLNSEKGKFLSLPEEILSEAE
jgi:hypothetical protein